MVDEADPFSLSRRELESLRRDLECTLLGNVSPQKSHHDRRNETYLYLGIPEASRLSRDHQIARGCETAATRESPAVDSRYHGNLHPSNQCKKLSQATGIFEILFIRTLTDLAQRFE